MDTVQQATTEQASQFQPLSPMPQHVAIIMDGNGRWARQRNLPRVSGHKAGTENIRRTVQFCVRMGIKYLTVYAFSTENWSRPAAEVDGIMRILGDGIRRETPILNENGVRIRHIGSTANLPHGLDHSIAESVELTRNNDSLHLCVAFNYGGRADIAQAVQRITAEGYPPAEITEELISRYLYTGGLPDPDLIIRTAGEWRLSNFLLWQSAYSEYWATQVYWPDFDEAAFYEALVAYSQRQRKFGTVIMAEQISPAEATEAS